MKDSGWSIGRNALITIVVIIILLMLVPYFALKSDSKGAPPAEVKENVPIRAPEMSAKLRLSLFKVGNGQGIIVSSPPGINCGADCNEDYPNGTSVILEVSASGSSQFVGWSGACAGVNGDQCTVVVDRPRSVVANFANEVQENRNQLIVSKDGTGTGKIISSLTGINCGSDCSETYPSVTEVRLTATPEANSTFSGWHGACSGTGVCLVSVRGTTSVIATFTTEGITRKLSVDKTGNGTGTVSSSPAGINCGADCVANYGDGTSVTLTATTAVGSTFMGWSGDCAGAGTCTIVMNGARAVTATFTEETPRYDLSVTKTGSGSGTVTSSPAGINCGATCSSTYDGGTEVTLTSTSGAGSIIVGWAGCDENPAEHICVVRMSAAKAVTVNYVRLRTLTVVKVGEGTGNIFSEAPRPGGIDCGPVCSYSLYHEGDSVVLSPIADPGSEFVSWSSCDAVSPDGLCQVILTGDKTVYPKFKLR